MAIKQRNPDWPADATSIASWCSIARISPKVFELWIAAGVPILQRASGPGHPWVVSPSQIIQWLWHHRDKSGMPSRQGSNLDASRARLADFQADVQELRAATMRAELLPAPEVVSGWQAAIGRARSLVLGVPTASAATLVLLARSRDAEEATTEVREHLRNLLDHALSELANTSLDEEEETAQEAKGPDAGDEP